MRLGVPWGWGEGDLARGHQRFVVFGGAIVSRSVSPAPRRELHERWAGLPGPLVFPPAARGVSWS